MIFSRNINLKNFPKEFIEQRCRQADFQQKQLKISLPTPPINKFFGDIFQIDISEKNLQFCDQYNNSQWKKNETAKSETWPCIANS